jgi:hypothetical protein
MTVDLRKAKTAIMQSRVIAVTGCEAQISGVKIDLYLHIMANILINGIFPPQFCVRGVIYYWLT